MKKFLTRQGYQINKKNINNITLEKIKKLLNIEINNIFSAKENIIYNILLESKDYICVPKIVGELYFKDYKTINTLTSKNINCEFTKELRDYQKKVIENCLKSFEKNKYGLIVLSCGLGKTCIALYLACILKYKTLILVDRTFLQDQWIERIKEFTNASIGFLRGDTIDVDKDITVGMVQSISKRNYSKDIFNNFGLVIYDECHTIASKIFCKALQKTCSLYNIGLTATPYRKDDLMKIVKWYLGDPIVNITRKPSCNVIVKRIHYIPQKDKIFFVTKTRKIKGKVMPDIQPMISNLCLSEERLNFIILMIINFCEYYPERKILLLGDRNEYIKNIKSKVDIFIKKKKLNTTSGLYIGKMDQEELLDSSKCTLIFSNYKMASTGLDIDGLNTLIFINSRKDVIQSIGRILRKPVNKGDQIPMIIDIIDTFSCFIKWAEERLKYYNKQTYTTENYFAYGNKINNPKIILNKLGITHNTYTEYKNNFKNMYDFKILSTITKKNFFHSNKLKTILYYPKASENEKIEVIENII